jgi:hypothetical protein
MYRIVKLGALVLGAAVLSASTPAGAVVVPSFTVIVDEFGTGLCTGFGCTGEITLPINPGPYSIPSNPLSYTLPFAATGGDVLLSESTRASTASDVLRFTPGTVSNTTLLQFSSDQDNAPGSIGALADTGTFGDFSSNLQTLTEGDLTSFGFPGLFGAVYTAPDTAPGSLPGVTANYIFVSDGQLNVPEPAALPLFATGLGLMGWFAWRRKRKTAVDGFAVA